MPNTIVVAFACKIRLYTRLLFLFSLAVLLAALLRFSVQLLGAMLRVRIMHRLLRLVGRYAPLEYLSKDASLSGVKVSAPDSSMIRAHAVAHAASRGGTIK